MSLFGKKEVDRDRQIDRQTERYTSEHKERI